MVALRFLCPRTQPTHLGGKATLLPMIKVYHPGLPSAHNASTKPASAAGTSSASTARSQFRVAARLSAAVMSIPITCPLGASRSWPWQASSTSQASCSWRLIRACSR